MSKLLLLKEWLTVNDTAKYLSVILGESVSPPDVIQLAINGRLDASIRFVNPIYARPCSVIDEQDAEEVDGIPVKNSLPYKVRLGRKSSYFPGKLIVPSGPVWNAYGIYEIPPMPENIVELEAIFQVMTRGPEVNIRGLDAIYFLDSNGALHEIVSRVSEVGWSDDFYNPENFCPSIEGLPDDASIVFKSTALLRFQEVVANKHMADKSVLSPLVHGTKDAATSLSAVGSDLKTLEKSTLLSIIYGMATAAPYTFNPAAKRSEAAAVIASATAAAGCPITDDTVRKWLKVAAEQFGKPNSGNN